MNELDRKKMTVYERTLGHFIDKLREFYSDLDTAIFSVKTISNNTHTAVTDLNDNILELKTKIDLLIRESSSQNAQLEKFRVEIRSSLERNFTEQRERMKRVIKKIPDEKPLEFAKAKDITGGPIIIPVDMGAREIHPHRRKNDPMYHKRVFATRSTDEGMEIINECRISTRILSYFGFGRLKVEL